MVADVHVSPEPPAAVSSLSQLVLFIFLSISFRFYLFSASNSPSLMLHSSFSYSSILLLYPFRSVLFPSLFRVFVFPSILVTTFGIHSPIVRHRSFLNLVFPSFLFDIFLYPQFFTSSD